MKDEFEEKFIKEIFEYLCNEIDYNFNDLNEKQKITLTKMLVAYLIMTL